MSASSSPSTMGPSLHTSFSSIAPTLPCVIAEREAFKGSLFGSITDCRRSVNRLRAVGQRWVRVVPALYGESRQEDGRVPSAQDKRKGPRTAGLSRSDGLADACHRLQITDHATSLKAVLRLTRPIH